MYAERHGSGERRVEIHSDGLLTPQPGEHIAEARQRCREALRRLSRAASVFLVSARPTPTPGRVDHCPPTRITHYGHSFSLSGNPHLYRDIL